MARISLRFLAAAIAASLLTGCNPMNTSGSTSYGTQDFTGNWYLTISDPPYPGPYPIATLTGAMSGSGQSVTATFRAGGTGCVSPTQDIAFTGSQLADGTLTLASTNLPNNVATISAIGGGAMPLTNQNALFLGGLVVIGSGSCTMGGITLRGEGLAPLSGTYTGPITSTSATTANFTATVAQAAANSDGQFPESGTITVAGATCTNTFALTGLVAGSALTATLTPISGPTATATVATGPPDGEFANTLAFSIIITGTGCNAGNFTGSLNKQ
jgi:hypothetical protein